jgi:hypothetical protein
MAKSRYGWSLCIVLSATVFVLLQSTDARSQIPPNHRDGRVRKLCLAADTWTSDVEAFLTALGTVKKTREEPWENGTSTRIFFDRITVGLFSSPDTKRHIEWFNFEKTTPEFTFPVEIGASRNELLLRLGAPDTAHPWLYEYECVSGVGPTFTFLVISNRVTEISWSRGGGIANMRTD